MKLGVAAGLDLGGAVGEVRWEGGGGGWEVGDRRWEGGRRRGTSGLAWRSNR